LVASSFLRKEIGGKIRVQDREEGGRVSERTTVLAGSRKRDRGNEGFSLRRHSNDMGFEKRREREKRALERGGVDSGKYPRKNKDSVLPKRLPIPVLGSFLSLHLEARKGKGRMYE